MTSTLNTAAACRIVQIRTASVYVWFFLIMGVLPLILMLIRSGLISWMVTG